MRSSYRPDIDGLRALSIVLVVAFHAGVSGVGGGYVGVDVFFVVSGFLITSLLVAEHEARGRVSLAGFFARRVRRLLPLSASVVVVSVAAGMLLLPPLRHVDLVGDARAATLYVANLRYANQAVAYSDTEVTDSLLTHYWSLSIEEQYYLLWPLIVLAIGFVVGRRWPHRFRAALGTVVALVVVGSLWSSIVNTHRLGPAAYYVTHTRLWEIGFGAALAIALPVVSARLRRLHPLLVDLIAGSGLLTIVVAATQYGAGTSYPGTAALAPVMGTAAVLATGAARTTMLSRVLSLRPFPLVGRWSYAWYLWHWPAIGIGLLLNQRAGEPFSPGAVTSLAVAASLALAIASHVLVENPVRMAPALQKLPRRSFALGGALMAVSLGVGPMALRVRDDGASVVAGPGAGAASPAQAAADLVSIHGASRCHLNYFQVDVSSDCVFGDPNGRVEIALIGDSHAQQWLPALDAFGRERGWRVLAWTKSACPLLDVPVFNTKFRRPYKECEEWRDAIVGMLAGRGHLDAVILTSSSSLHRMLLGPDGELLEDRDAIQATWERGTKTTLPMLLDHADRVVRLFDTPWSPLDVPVCLSEHPRDPATCDFDRTWKAGRDRDLLAAEHAAVKSLGVADEVTFVDVRDLVCPDDPCRVIRRDGTIVYRDQHHLTQTFVLQLADDLGDRVAAAMAGGPESSGRP